MHDFNYKAFEELEKTIRNCARLAADAQKDIRRFYKEDGSVLTQTDLKISSIVEEAVTELFPSSSFVCEESPVIRKDSEDYGPRESTLKVCPFFRILGAGSNQGAEGPARDSDKHAS